MIVLVAVLGVLAATWGFARPRTLTMTPAQDQATGPGIDMSVVIPARNEADNLPNLLASLRSCYPKPAEVIVVDDGSDDGTAEVARSFGATVIVATTLPDGWVGKNWACHLGAQAATSSVLVFLDADTRLAPEAIGALLRTHQQCGGLVSVQPFHRTQRLTEDLSALFNAVSLMSAGAFGVRQPAQLRMAFGPCLVTSAADYRAIGGHESVRDEVVEDIALAGRYADSGRAVSCRLGGSLLSFRMYPDGTRAMTQGWTKNIAVGARRSPPGSAVPAAAWITSLAAVAAALLTGLLAWASGASPPWGAAIAWVVSASHLALVLRRIGSFRAITSIVFVVPLAYFIVVFLRSAVIAARGSTATWRGREVSLQARGH